MRASTDTPGINLFQRLFSIAPNEVPAVAWSFVYFFCVLSAYYILRPVRETMAVGSGPDTIPFLFVGTFVVMMIASPIFGWVASRYPRRKFLPWVYGFFVLNMLIFWVVFSRRIDIGSDHVWLGRTFFVWLSVFNLFVVSVYWSFMADIYSREQGRRLFGLLSAGGSIGGLLGGALTSLVVTDIGFQNLFPISAALLLFAIVCIRKLGKWVVHEHEEDIDNTAASGKPLGGNAFSGITHVFRSRYFIAIVVSSIIASLLGTALYMFAAQLVETAISDADARTRFFSNINVASLFLTLIGQMFLVRHVVRRFGIGVSLSLLPILSVVSFIILAIDPVLSVVAIITVARRALGFSFSKPTSDMLYSVVTPEEKYKTKNFIDTAVYRFGDVLGTWAIKLMAGLGMTGVALVLLPFAIIWALIALWLGRDYRRRARKLRDVGVT